MNMIRENDIQAFETYLYLNEKSRANYSEIYPGSAQAYRVFTGRGTDKAAVCWNTGNCSWGR